MTPFASCRARPKAPFILGRRMPRNSSSSPSTVLNTAEDDEQDEDPPAASSACCALDARSCRGCTSSVRREREDGVQRLVRGQAAGDLRPGSAERATTRAFWAGRFEWSARRVETAATFHRRPSSASPSSSRTMSGDEEELPDQANRQKPARVNASRSASPTPRSSESPTAATPPQPSVTMGTTAASQMSRIVRSEYWPSLSPQARLWLRCFGGVSG